MNLASLFFFQALAGSRRILLAVAGGGFDVDWHHGVKHSPVIEEPAIHKWRRELTGIRKAGGIPI